MEAVSKIPNNLLMDFFIHNPSFVKIYHLVFKEVADGQSLPYAAFGKMPILLIALKVLSSGII